MDANFFAEHWIELLFSLLSVGIVGYIRHLVNVVNKYQKLMNDQNEERIREIIKEELKPVMDEITIERKKFEALKNDYRSKLIRKCEEALQRGSVTMLEFNILTELWKVYHEGLGGNGQGEDFYQRVCQLPLKTDDK